MNYPKAAFDHYRCEMGGIHDSLVAELGYAVALALGRSPNRICCRKACAKGLHFDDALGLFGFCCRKEGTSEASRRSHMSTRNLQTSVFSPEPELDTRSLVRVRALRVQLQESCSTTSSTLLRRNGYPA